MSEKKLGPNGGLMVDVVFPVDGSRGSLDLIFDSIMWNQNFATETMLADFKNVMEVAAVNCICFVVTPKRKRLFLGPSLYHQERCVRDIW